MLPALYGEPDSRYKMPEVNMGSSIVTAMPVMENAVSLVAGLLLWRAQHRRTASMCCKAAVSGD